MSNSGKGSGAAFLILGLLVLGGGIGGYYFMNKGKFLPPNGPRFNKPDDAKTELTPVGPFDNRPKKDPVAWPAVMPVKKAVAVKLPFILWGGDVATFHANGARETQPGSLFAEHGLKFSLSDGNNFEEQVKDYLSGESPFLRGTLSMLAQKCDVLGKDPRTQPVVFLQMTWSAGDHMVARDNMKTLADIRGKKIALQEGGPHVGMLDDILRTARLNWNEVDVVWTTDVTGDNGPAELFRKDPSIDACFAITPDMSALSGGLDATGDGQNNTVAGAHVLVSTADMKRSIADVYACRKDWYDAHRGEVEKFTAAYLKACENLLELRRQHRKQPNPEYQSVLTLAQTILGKEGVPTLDDAAGLVDDAVFVGLHGNKAFFTEKGNLSGFDFKQRFLLDFALEQGYVSQKTEFVKPGFDYARIEQLGKLTVKAPPVERFRKDVKLLPENTIYSFVIAFEADQSTFPEDQYSKDFERALQQASLFGNAVLVIRGHADPVNVVASCVESGRRREVIRIDENRFTLRNGSPFDPHDIKQVLSVVNENTLYFFDGQAGREDLTQPLRDTVGYLKNLSERRADTVRRTVVGFAGKNQWLIDPSQIKAQGVGVTEPEVTWPQTEEQCQKNRRVEFRLIRVTAEARAEAVDESGFDF